MEKRFTKNVSTRSTLLSFHFLKVLTNIYPRYLVTVKRGSKAYPFYLELKGGQWDFVHPEEHPRWLRQMKAALEETILEQEVIA